MTLRSSHSRSAPARDAALELKVECGGWCPHDRSAEDGVIPSRYPVTPLPSGSNRERTRRNVFDSDATVIICVGEPRGGTRDTLDDCREMQTPHLLIDPTSLDVDQAAARLRDFIERHGVRALNVAGPRASEDQTAGPFAYRLIRAILE